MKQHPHKSIINRLAEDTSLRVWAWLVEDKIWARSSALGVFSDQESDYVYALGPKPTAPPAGRCTLGGLSFPKPVRVAPAYGTEYWLVGRTTAGPTPYTWYDGAADRRWLAANLLHLTEARAREQADAMAAALQGAVEEAR